MTADTDATDPQVAGSAARRRQRCDDTTTSQAVPQTHASARPDALARPDPLDTSKAHVARRYDYLLGGKDNLAIDRQSGDRIVEVFPTITTAVAENRAFLRRAVGFLAEEAGVRQFLDIGVGLPAPHGANTHQIAQDIAAQARVVYVDNDPLVLAHARALLTGTREGATAYLDADLREPDTILKSTVLRDTLDLTLPVGLLLLAILHFIPDACDPYGIVARLVAVLPPGSFLAISHATNEYMTAEQATAGEAAATASSHTPFKLRSRTEISQFLTGLQPVDPGLISVADWRSEHERQPRPSPADTAILGAIARIPDRAFAGRRGARVRPTVGERWISVPMEQPSAGDAADADQ